VFSRDIYENLNPFHSVLFVTIFLKMHKNNDGRSCFKVYRPQICTPTFACVFLLQIHSAKLSYCVLAGVQSEYSSIFVVMLWWTETRLCGIGCCNWPECVVLVKGYSDRPQWSEKILLQFLVLN
jgi:hypothetical protein